MASANLPRGTEGKRLALPIIPNPNSEAKLLLEAFEMFTQASSSLESAFEQLEARAERLSQELEVKNAELERSLKENQEVRNYLRTILESLPCGVVVMDLDNHVALANPVASAILALPKNGAPNTRRKAGSIRNAAMRRYFAEVGVNASPNQETEIPLFGEGGARIVATAATPLYSSGGVREGTIHILRDVTEVKKLEEQNKRGERLGAMGEMAVELAHEIRNPLGSIELFASLLEKELPRDSDPGRWAENIRVGSRSLNNIVSNMLQFANPHSPSFGAVDVHPVIHEILGFADPIMRQREVRVVKQFDAEASTISGDRELLKQMLLNLILNAMQAMPSHGSLSISTRNVGELPGGAPCPGIELQVMDTGLGIASENVSRIFDPFFTTNRNGTGLGLSVVHQIVEKHSGFIQVESRVNQGTTFTMVFPVDRFGIGSER